MGSKTLPEQLKTALEHHVEQSDVREDSDIAELFVKLTTLSDKVQAAKEKALANRKSASLTIKR